MSSELSQAGRLLEVYSTLAPDKLVVRSLSGREAISRCYSFEVEFASEDVQIKASDLIATPIAIGILTDTAERRYIHGVVNEFVLLPSADRYARYRARIVPYLWMLTQTSNCRIWQEKTVPEIIEDVFKNYGLTAVKFKLSRSYSKREYCVQYRETAYDFLSRLMEEEGICFYFEHGLKKHTLLLVDQTSGHVPCPLNSHVRWEPSTGTGFLREESNVLDWERSLSVHPKIWTQGDFSFMTPRSHLLATEPTQATLNAPDLERYDYPGGFATPAQGDALTKLRMEQEEAGIDVIAGIGTARGFLPGCRFKLEDHYRREQNGEYLLTAVDHSAYQAGLFGGEATPEDKYENRFVCIPAHTPFRPPLVTAKPVIAGPQTAFVTGVGGEEIYVDQYGRVKVQFHWDRDGKYDDKSSCWIRVVQPIAGKMYGNVNLPRIGHEVVVTFLEGNPDRPLITGSVYNAEAKPPYKLPDEKTKTTFRSNSSKGGGGFNEFRFEDAKGKEQVFMNAQRNYDLRVGKDLYNTIIGESHTITTKDSLAKIKGDHHLSVDGDQNQKIGGTASLDITGDWEQKVGSNFAVQSGTEIHLKAGMNLVVESGTNLTLKVGGNFVVINPGGIFIKGTMVMINSGGSAGSGAGASPAVPLEAKEADKAEPGSAIEVPPPQQTPKAVTYSPQALALKQAAQSSAPFCDI